MGHYEDDVKCIKLESNASMTDGQAISTTLLSNERTPIWKTDPFGKRLRGRTFSKMSSRAHIFKNVFEGAHFHAY
jgi:hypothetical protein